MDFIYFQMLQTSLLLTFKISFTYGFSNSHVWMWKLHHKEGWALKNWCFWTVMLKKTLESPLDSKDIKKVILKEINWIFIGSTDAEAEVPILWPPDAESQLIRKDPDAGKDWRQEEKGMTEDEMVGWCHRSMDMRLSKLWDISQSCFGSILMYILMKLKFYLRFECHILDQFTKNYQWYFYHILLKQSFRNRKEFFLVMRTQE